MLFRSNLRYRVDVVTTSVCLAEKGKNFNSSKSNTSSFDNKDYMTAAVTTTDQSQSSCIGTATVAITDGTPPYTYLWDDPASQTTATATGLCAGNYNVTVYDADGDSIVESGSVGTISGLTSSIASTDASQDTCNGTATITVAGGTAPYTYLWDEIGRAHV